MRLYSQALLFAWLILTACRCDAPNLEKMRFSCDDDGTCAKNFRCYKSVCTKTTEEGIFGFKFALVPENPQSRSKVCSTLIEIESRNSNGVDPEPVPEDLAVNLTASAGVLLFADSMCTTPLSSLTIPKDQVRASFYFRPGTAGTFSVTPTATDYSTGPLSLLGTASSPSQLVWVNKPSTQRAGACSSVFRLQLQDFTSAPFVVSTPETVSISSAPSGLSIFTDATCTTPAMGSVSIAAGTSNAEFYARAATGNTYTINANASFAAPAATLMVSPIVRKGTCQLGSNATSVDCPITPPIAAVNSAFVIHQASSNGLPPSASTVRCDVVSTTNVRCDRFGAPESAQIAYQVVERASGLTVQHFDVPCVAPTEATTDVTTSTVDPTKAFLLYSVASSSASFGEQDISTFQMPSATQVQLTHGPAGCTANQKRSVQVVEWAGANVTRATQTNWPANGATLTVNSLSQVSLASTIALLSYRLSADSMSRETLCDRVLRFSLPANNSVLFSRGAGDFANCIAPGFPMAGSPINVDAVSWERVDFQTTAKVQSVFITVPAGQAMTTAPIAVVDATRSFVIASPGPSGQGAGENSSFAHSNNFIGASTGLLSLTGASPLQATGVQVERASTVGDAQFTIYVVEVVP